MPQKQFAETEFSSAKL